MMGRWVCVRSLLLGASFAWEKTNSSNYQSIFVLGSSFLFSLLFSPCALPKRA
jgi:hypothetical protein